MTSLLILQIIQTLKIHNISILLSDVWSLQTARKGVLTMLKLGRKKKHVEPIFTGSTVTISEPGILMCVNGRVIDSRIVEGYLREMGWGQMYPDLNHADFIHKAFRSIKGTMITFTDVIDAFELMAHEVHIPVSFLVDALAKRTDMYNRGYLTL